MLVDVNCFVNNNLCLQPKEEDYDPRDEEASLERHENGCDELDRRAETEDYCQSEVSEVKRCANARCRALKRRIYSTCPLARVTRLGEFRHSG
jgi:hypothetical protein